MSIIRPPTWTGIMPTTVNSGIQRQPARLQVGDLPLGVGQVHVQRRRIAIDQQRHGALVADDLGRGGEGHRGHQHGLARLQSQRLDGQMQRRRAGVDGHGVLGAHRFGQVGLELPRAARWSASRNAGRRRPRPSRPRKWRRQKRNSSVPLFLLDRHAQFLPSNMLFHRGGETPPAHNVSSTLPNLNSRNNEAKRALVLVRFTMCRKRRRADRPGTSGQRRPNS